MGAQRYECRPCCVSFSAQAALDAPRFCISAGSPDSLAGGAAGDINSEVYFEEGIVPEVVEKLRCTYCLLYLCLLRGADGVESDGP